MTELCRASQNVFKAYLARKGDTFRFADESIPTGIYVITERRDSGVIIAESETGERAVLSDDSLIKPIHTKLFVARKSRLANAIRDRDRVAREILRIWERAMAEYATHNEIVSHLTKVWVSENFTKLTNDSKSFIRGYNEAFRSMVQTMLTHSYVCVDGVRRPHGQYKLPSENSPESIADTNSCELIWKAALPEIKIY